ncbi:MAG: hypothetical protein KDA89_25730, partial [Planctomycetaceae bacterium]|nr:hypothetical protein [Planctomycetaceae bacterium]
MCRHLTFVTVLLVCQSVFAQSGSENQPVEASPQQIEALADNEGGELDPGHVRMPVAKTVEAMRQALTESTCIVYEFDGEEATEMFRALDDQGKAKLAEAILRSLEGNDAAAGVEHGLGAIGSISALVLSYPGESWNRSGRYIPQIVAQLERQSAERK